MAAQTHHSRIAGTSWNPSQYLTFGGQRLRPALETLTNGGPHGGPLGSGELREAVGRPWVEDAGYYYDLLAGRTSSLDIWETEYLQVLEGEDPILEAVSLPPPVHRRPCLDRAKTRGF